ncbi:MAG: hypothetical protein MJZ48_02750 [Paludibacteraceae bacterium]|nr:hypothetical protein [Paludibacteraceae bacterium]
MKITLSNLVQSISGTIDGVTYVTRNGKTYAYRRHSSQPRIPTPKEQDARRRFTLAQQQTNEILHTTHLRARYEAQWKKHQHQFHTLRGYIFHCLYEV